MSPADSTLLLISAANVQEQVDSDVLLELTKLHHTTNNKKQHVKSHICLDVLKDHAGLQSVLQDDAGSGLKQLLMRAVPLASLCAPACLPVLGWHVTTGTNNVIKAAYQRCCGEDRCSTHQSCKKKKSIYQRLP